MVFRRKTEEKKIPNCGTTTYLVGMGKKKVLVFSPLPAVSHETLAMVTDTNTMYEATQYNTCVKSSPHGDILGWNFQWCGQCFVEDLVEMDIGGIPLQVPSNVGVSSQWLLVRGGPVSVAQSSQHRPPPPQPLKRKSYQIVTLSSGIPGSTFLPVWAASDAMRKKGNVTVLLLNNKQLGSLTLQIKDNQFLDSL
ncbi:hypothetical protein Cgig2_015507 [Carnegiea gigantea]|uniref:Uncharacterized protein n=1 Tax=Carnegiea gigantea TaxID=171969 RepID=A0A9Q1KDJ6_9CARY|nr:hypothetical protein Cgig2_015507 [Carnegiea gigantea]